MLGLSHRRASQFCPWSLRLPTRPFPTPLAAQPDPAVRRASTCPLPPQPIRVGAPRAPLTPTPARRRRADPPSPPRALPVPECGRCGGCAKPVPRSPSRAPTLEAAAPPSSRARGAGSAGTGGGQRGDPAPARRPTRWAERKAGPRTGPPQRSRARLAARHPAARGAARRGAEGGVFPEPGCREGTGDPRSWSGESTAQRKGAGETGRAGAGRGGVGGQERVGPPGERGREVAEPAGARSAGREGASGAHGRGAAGRALTWGTRPQAPGPELRALPPAARRVEGGSLECAE